MKYLKVELSTMVDVQKVLAKKTKTILEKSKLKWLNLLTLRKSESSNNSIFEIPAGFRIGPLLETNWHQGIQFTNETPKIIWYSGGSGMDTVQGCVANAMSKIMYYWETPKCSTGNVKYETYCDDGYTEYEEKFVISDPVMSENIDDFGNRLFTISREFNRCYDWQEIGLEQFFLTTSEFKDWLSIDKIDFLMADAAIAAKSDFGIKSTSAGFPDARDAFVNNFKFDKDDIELFEMDEVYTSEDVDYWETRILKGFLPSAPISSGLYYSTQEYSFRPILYGLTYYEKNEITSEWDFHRHAVVIDGFWQTTEERFFHLNIGWQLDGSFNGWYNLNRVDLSSDMVGKIIDNKAIINIHPYSNKYKKYLLSNISTPQPKVTKYSFYKTLTNSLKTKAIKYSNNKSFADDLQYVHYYAHHNGSGVCEAWEGGYAIARGDGIYKTDRKGNVLMSNSNIHGYMITNTSDGGYLVAAQNDNSEETRGMVIKINEKLGDQWSYTLNDDFMIRSIKHTLDGGYLILSNVPQDDPTIWKTHITKLKYDGSRHWQAYYERPDVYSEVEGLDITQGSDGTYMMVGRMLPENETGGYGPGSYKNFLIKYDIDGNIIAEQEFGPVVKELGSTEDEGSVRWSYIHQSGENQYVVIGREGGALGKDPYLVMSVHDADGNQIDSISFGTDLEFISQGIIERHPNYYSTSVVSAFGEGYIVVADAIEFWDTDGDNETDAIYMFKINNNGQQEWVRRFDENDISLQDTPYGTTDFNILYSNISSVTTCSDGGYLIFRGNKIIKTDENGNAR